MRPISSLFDYITNPRDQARLFTNPVLLMPFEGALPPLTQGPRRYVLASDGLYVQAKTRVLKVTVPLARVTGLPFGPLAPSVELAGGPIPFSFFEQIEEAALHHHPNEWSAFIHWDEEHGEYALTVPRTRSRSGSHIAYDTDAVDPERLVLDVHTHGAFSAYFSPVDDASNLFGLYFASVLGCCGNAETLEVVSRLVIDQHRLDLAWHPWQADILSTLGTAANGT